MSENWFIKIITPPSLTHTPLPFTLFKCSLKHSSDQGTNARKVISEVYAFFVLQSTVFGRKSKHNTDVTAWHGINFYKNNLWNILVIGNYFVNFQNYQILMLLTPSDNKRTLHYKKCVHLWNNFPCISTLVTTMF